MFELYLVRHGKTTANEKNLYCGFSDIPLSKLGRKEVLKIKGLYPSCDGYYSSGMLRCNETLEIIRGKKAHFTAIPMLREINVGQFELKSYDELKNSKEYIRWIYDKSGTVTCPGGESKNMFSQRVSMGLLLLTDKILKASGENPSQDAYEAMCVTHGGVIVTIMEILFGKGKNFYEWQPEPGFGYMLTHDGDNGYTTYEKIVRQL